MPAMADHRTLRICTVNLDHFDDDRRGRLELAAAEIRRHRSQVVLLQEVSPLEATDTTTDTATVLAERLDMNVAVRSANGNAVLSALPAEHAEVVDLGDADAATVVLDTGCHRFLVVSTHLAWGTGKEHTRLQQAMRLDDWIAVHAPLDPQRADTPALYAVLGGDLNSEPDSATLRWLHGREVHDGRSTLWVDAWRAGSGAGYTSTPENPYAGRTAALVGITRPDLLPARRIDHLLSRGFAHGRVAAPLRAELLGRGSGRAFGDHYGVAATFLC